MPLTDNMGAPVGDVPLHHRLGKNLRRFHCSLCREPVSGACFIGKYNAIVSCPRCSTTGLGPEDDFVQCTCGEWMEQDRILADEETIPGGGLCEKCSSRMAGEWKDAVEAGGKVIRCVACNSIGILPFGSKMLESLTREGKITKDSLGIDIPAESCPRCFMRNLREPYGAWEVELIESLYKTDGANVDRTDVEEVASHDFEGGLEVPEPPAGKKRKGYRSPRGRREKSKD